MADEKTEEVETKKKGKGLLIPAVVLAVGLVVGGYFFMSSSKAKPAAGATSTTTTTALGKIVSLDPITLNLSDGHVLKVGMALQLTAKPKDKEIAAATAGGGGEGGSSSASSSKLGGQEAKALDLAIADLGNKTFDELSKPGGRTAAKEELSEKIHEAYEGDVVSVYFTNFVMS